MRAGKLTEPTAPHYILGPTAIVLAIQGEPEIKDGKIILSYKSPIDELGSPTLKLNHLATLVQTKSGFTVVQ